MTQKFQRGAVLAVGLIFLLVLTVLGLAAVRFTTQQSRMAAGYQFQTSTFHGAESAIRGVMGEIRGEIAPPSGTTTNILVDAITTPSGEDPPGRSYDLDSAVTSQAVVDYEGQGPAAGYSLGVGSGAIVAHRFRIEADSSLTSTSAQSRHDQGVQRVGPGF